MSTLPKRIDLTGQSQFRIIPSVYPTINFFEELVDPSEMDVLFEIESLTNERLRQEIGDIFLVPKKDRVSGPGSSVIMAAFTHIGKASRFTDGTYGVYYASLTRETAIYETVYHRERFLRATSEPECEVMMRVYEGKIMKPLHDIRLTKYNQFHDPNNYLPSQQFGKEMKESNIWGIVYRSVRHYKGECVALFRPPAISIPLQTAHLRYLWNGEKITEVLDARPILKFA